MTKPKTYLTASAFRTALESRLQTLALQKNTNLQRLRREVAFDRFLARLFFQKDPPWILKGGYAMELHIEEARATKDIDLAWREAFPKGKGSPSEMVLAKLQAAAALDLGDFFGFFVGEPDDGIEGAPYGGTRYPVEARMDGRLFVAFHVDMGIGDVVIEPSEQSQGQDWLEFAGIPPAVVKAIPREQHFAEKFHVYTQPRQTPNSRVRDLVDMVLLIQARKMNAKRVRKAVKATFDRRKTHSVPRKLERPPTEWQRPFAALAAECHLEANLDEAFQIAELYVRRRLHPWDE